jgi:hypothetical protein
MLQLTRFSFVAAAFKKIGEGPWLIGCHYFCFLQALSWRVVGEVPVFVKICHYLLKPEILQLHFFLTLLELIALIPKTDLTVEQMLIRVNVN